MIMRFSLALLAGILMPVFLSAQTWSAEQQQVIDQIETCFESWWEATNNNDFNAFVGNCPCDEDYAVWSTAFGAPIGLDAVQDVFADGVASPSAVAPTVFIRPTRVKVDGDMAVIFYYINVYNVDPGSAFLNLNEAKRTTVLHRVDGQWQLFAGMVAPSVSE